MSTRSKKFAEAKSGLKRDLLNYLYNSQITGTFKEYNFIYERLYKQIGSIGSQKWANDYVQGAIFNLKFSPDGRTLIAACENSCLQIYDPINFSKICDMAEAHSRCVNCIHFLDMQNFATGSDDKTIRIWDLRKLIAPLKVLTGHEGWVKNIGYDKNRELLMSSSFDGTVRTWDINDPDDKGNIPNYIAVKQSALIRAKLSNDCSKLFLTLTDGNGVMVFHDLNLRTISDDLSKPRPSSQHRNRLEWVTDSPKDMWCVYSIDVHPFDWCIATRFVKKDQIGEKLATFDIQNVHLGGCDIDCEHYSTMTHYIDESSFASGFIKEISFSSDGRVISSPFKKGVRLLAFDPNCHELCDCVPKSLNQLSVVNTFFSHKRNVLTSAFSPLMPLLATGCRAGDVHFHLPRF